MRLLRLTLVLSLMSVAGWGTSVLYTNGPISGTIGGSSINEGYEVSDAFELSYPSMLTGVSNVGLWVVGGDTPETLSYIISTAPDGGGTVEDAGVDITLSTNFFETVGGFDIYSASFSTGTPTLSPGTYYLELFNATSNNAGPVYWDINAGPSWAGSNGAQITSESFGIDGVAPEPTSVVLSGLGLMALAGMARLRRKQFQT
jgi:hypothetical protein